jgi:hypothetical protein
VADSILTSVKKVLNLAEDYTFFDPDIILHINSVFSTLNQLGVGPDAGFMIEDATATWADFLDNNPQYNFVKTYMCLSVRMLFDPPSTAHHMQAAQAQIDQYVWRISVLRESTGWVPGVVVPPPVDPCDY